MIERKRVARWNNKLARKRFVTTYLVFATTIFSVGCARGKQNKDVPFPIILVSVKTRVFPKPVSNCSKALILIFVEG